MEQTKKKKLILGFDLKFDEIKDINDSFALGRCAIAYAGRNRNKSDIAKDIFEAALPSLKNCPVVCHYTIEEDQVGGHDIAVAHDANGNAVLVNETVPFGVVPESATQYWQEIEGRNYLFTDIIFWKRQPVYQYYVDHKISGQSMEISVPDDGYYIDEDGFFVIQSFQFEALCALGVGHEPCFEDANIQLFSKQPASDFSTQFSLMMDELKQLKNFTQVESEENMHEEMVSRVLAEFGKSIEDIDFEITELMTEDELRAHFEVPPVEPSAPVSFAATYIQKRDALRNALEPVYEKDERGCLVKETYSWLVDFDDEYAYIEQDEYTADGCKSKRGRRRYNYVAENATVEFTSDFEEMVIVWLTLDENAKLEQSRNAFELVQAEFETYKSEYSTPNTEVDELRVFKDSHLEAERKANADAVIAEFDDIVEHADFSKIDAVKYEISVDELTEKCFALRGKMAQVKPKSKAQFTRIPATQSDVSDPAPYGGLGEKYLNR